jgi:hypothetical protein
MLITFADHACAEHNAIKMRPETVSPRHITAERSKDNDTLSLDFSQLYSLTFLVFLPSTAHCISALDFRYSY